MFRKQVESEKAALALAIADLTLKQEQLEFQHEVSMQLIHNILPKQAAERLQERLREKANDLAEDLQTDKEACAASVVVRSNTSSSQYSQMSEHRHPIQMASVVTHLVDFHRCAVLYFADVVGFTALSQKVSPEQLVQSLSTLVTQVDKGCELHSVEKVKTIGDCYMAISIPSDDLPVSARRSCKSMLRLANYVHKVAPRLRLAGQPMIMRAGMSIGPVVGGVIGLTKFVYDYWGDTVNEASRMESTGLPGATQVSAVIYDHLKDEFEFECRGLVQMKGKGEVEAYVHHPHEKIQHFEVDSETTESI
eukprot:NODE_585_length_1585_cov_111.085938_g481_i0.p1 GENE.NODE_585_length_1585_cov_111.085938_g481_i0~~NODE_585_length_1585_cov_111.085938_g481_i0.p1  ORF type:complete len:307 (-),score=69.06 NODE_585_length_1585_cov_111.085938_g481_i0:45-965(-)